MDWLNVLLSVVIVQGAVCYKDPAACPRTIKMMLLKVCGEAKRHVDSLGLGLPVYPVFTNEEVDRLYDDMVEKNMIKGVKKERSPEAGDDKYINEDWHNKLEDVHPLDSLYFRKKRQLMDVHKDYFFKDPESFNGHGKKIYSLPESSGRLDPSPPPGALKAKCCGGYLCTMDDFRGFCI